MRVACSLRTEPVEPNETLGYYLNLTPGQQEAGWLASSSPERMSLFLNTRREGGQEFTVSILPRGIQLSRITGAKKLPKT